MSRHINNGNCDKCAEIFEAYPGFYQPLQDWFQALQKKVPDAHISCAGRGYVAQEDAFSKGLSRAHYGKSSHNYNGAIDIFRLTQANGASWDSMWFRDKIGTAVFSTNADPDRKIELNWYGKPGSTFFELPHIEAQEWQAMVAHGELQLVEVLEHGPSLEQSSILQKT